ncbi:MAG: hypothetical protein KJ565_20690 [Gammaproteobacteria bacterium]|jgi:hypothetical protein|uniref:hypothetical protein n=1 Tax=Hydrogenophaga sp. TaxID=1904254 RepID=UPI0025BFE7CC|nr:hypothetical protein [Hydrogenophaga sp.]MBU4184120.1 hypothetical protein [Gammaproteobacteria bacterium]MBU4279070.1 hypothetical protein [Gammaproteobacteria bacterium]MBU4322278.1 hypothetical protein [Gammaproteobacteria bacterium]MCG2656484.1 hypothetical protein [Hydrogenophaga sp.]MDP2020853.1 hypothetical protein [Hydrogenophaga sp.]
MKTPLVLWCAALAVGVRIPRLNQLIPWTIKKNTEVVHRTYNWMDLRLIAVN